MQNVPSLDPSEVRKTLSKGVDLSRDGGVGFAREKAYSGSLSRLLLRAHREWRGYRAADERDEFPPLHVSPKNTPVLCLKPSTLRMGRE